MEKTVSFNTLGCRLNFSESSSIAGQFKDRGYRIVDFGDPADIVFLNTCTVTDKADSTCRNLIRKAQKSSPEAKIIVAGCYAQMQTEEVAKMQGVDLILGTTEKFNVFDYLEEEEEELVIKVDKTQEFFTASTTKGLEQTRAFLKIQDGCNYVCSFCIIPMARGRSRAMEKDEILKETHNLVANGFKEVVLTGVNIGEYEASTGVKLSEVLKEMEKIPALKRIRLSSVEPNTFTPDLVELLASSKKFLPHFHLPLQSGSDEILRSMKRKYTISDYQEVISKLKAISPETTFGADVICGFPGETEEQFLETYEQLRQLPITHFHVFPYSKRKNTVAARLENHIPYHVKKQRVKALIKMGEEKLSKVSENMIGKKTQVLFERSGPDGYYEGYSENFLCIKVRSTKNIQNQILLTEVADYKNGQLFGVLV